MFGDARPVVFQWAGHTVEGRQCRTIVFNQPERHDPTAEQSGVATCGLKKLGGIFPLHRHPLSQIFGEKPADCRPLPDSIGQATRNHFHFDLTESQAA